jgi:hypothetical protein
MGSFQFRKFELRGLQDWQNSATLASSQSARLRPMEDFDDFESTTDLRSESPGKPKLNGCLRHGLIFGGIGCLGILVLFAGLAYIGFTGPETSVYQGRNVPERYVSSMRELGALEEDEELLYFYSDGGFGIEEGFYFVSDTKVCIYIDGVAEPLQKIRFDEIERVELEREESFFLDSQITLHLNDGTEVWFPVSSELERDVGFHAAIEERLTQ